MKKLTLIIISLVIVMMSWENSLEAKGIIPDDSIRIRILANSDSVADQWIKRKVRDAIIAETRTWTSQLVVEEIDSARRIIENQLPQILNAAEQTLEQYGFNYGVKVELGEVDFPTKAYGSHIYPENQYEALRITLGNGEGENWWCVLFPPLCFIDGTTVKDNNPQKPVDNNVDKTRTQTKNQKTENMDQKTAAEPSKSTDAKPKAKPALFIVDLWNSLF